MKGYRRARALIAMLVLAVTTATAMLAVSTSAAADVCGQARTLVSRGYPAEAIALIEQARDLGFSSPTSSPPPTSTPPPTAAAGGAATTTGLCEDEYVAALELQASPEAQTAATCIAAASLIDAEDYAGAIALIQKTRDAARERLTSGEVVPPSSPSGASQAIDSAADPSTICEPELATAREGASGSVGSLATAWSDFRAANVDPLASAALLIGSTIVGLLILTRLLVTLPFMSDPLTRKPQRNLAALLGTVGVVCAPIAAVVVARAECTHDEAGGCDGAISWTAFLSVAFWVVVAIGASFVLAYALGSRLRLSVQGRGSVVITPPKTASASGAESTSAAGSKDDTKDASGSPSKVETKVDSDSASQKATKATAESTSPGDTKVVADTASAGDTKATTAAAQPAGAKDAKPAASAGNGGPRPIPFLAHLREMGGSPARGVEVPTGTDVADVAPLLEGLPNSKVLKWLVRVWDVVVNATPWKVSIDDTDTTGDEVAVTISRNGRAVAQEIVSVTSTERLLGRGTFPASKRPEVLASLAAAYVLWTLRHRYESEIAPGLYGATRWESIAYHYLATVVLGYGERTQAIKLLEAAVEMDRENRLAVTALWLYRFRSSTEDPGALKAYRYLMFTQVRTHIDDSPHRDELCIRQWMTFEALTRNLRALQEDDDLAAHESSIEELRARIGELIAATPPDTVTAALYETWRQRWAIDMARADVRRSQRIRDAEPSRLQEQRRTWLDAAEDSTDPAVAFSLACHRAMRYKEQRGIVGTAPATWRDVPNGEWEDVARLLRISRVVPVIADWEPHDPELAGFAEKQRRDARSVFTPLVIGRHRPAAATLAPQAADGADLEGFGPTALEIMAEGRTGSTDPAWLHANRRSPAGELEVKRVFHELQNKFGYPGRESDVAGWMEELGANPTPTTPSVTANTASAPTATAGQGGTAAVSTQQAPADSPPQPSARRFVLVWRRNRETGDGDR